MSSISSISGLESYVLQQINNQGAVSNQMDVSKPSRPPGGGPKGAMLESAVEQYAEEQGLDEETVTALTEQIKTELATIFAGGQGNHQDSRLKVDSAIMSVFEENGLDGEAFLEELKASMPPPPPPVNNNGASATDYYQSTISQTLLNLVDEEV